MIGKTINRYKVVSSTNNRVLLAHNPNACEPWVVWWVDRDGDPYAGSYFSNRDAAINEFISRSF